MKTGEGRAKAIGLKSDAVRAAGESAWKAATSELEEDEEEEEEEGDLGAALKKRLRRRRRRRQQRRPCLKLW